jgi:RNAse (barnase) inhibitor barstar
LTVNIELEPNDTYAEIIGKVARELQREISKSEQVKKALKSVWDFVSKWKVLGVEYKGDTLPPTKAMLEELADKLVMIADRINGEYQGIYIFIDEADKPDSAAGLGEFVKVLTERLTKRGAMNVGLGIIGISTVIEKMKESHESSVRIMTPIPLEPLVFEDRREVVRRGLKEAANKNGFDTNISPEALNLIASLSEGYPHFIQQYAYSAYAHDSDNLISEEDVRIALVKDGGALQLLGQRYFENMYTDELRSDDYRTVLQVLAKHMPAYVARKQIILESGLKSHTVSNALGACKKRGSVLSQKGKAGRFRLPSSSFAAWIQAFKVAQPPQSE